MADTFPKWLKIVVYVTRFVSSRTILMPLIGALGYVLGSGVLFNATKMAATCDNGWTYYETTNTCYKVIPCLPATML